MMIGNKMVTKPQEMAEEMNRYFVEKIATLKQNSDERTDHTESLNELEEALKEKKDKLKFELKTLNNKEMKTILKKLKNKRSSGLDTICSFSLKLSSGILFEKLKHIVNLSIQNGGFCQEWKKLLKNG